MRALHVYKDVFPPVAGGIERHIGDLRRTLPGVTSDVLVAARGPRTQRERREGGIEVRVAELGRVWSVPLAPAFPVWLRRLRADLIHVHMPQPLGELAALLAAGPVPVVASFHADVVRQASVMPLYAPLVRGVLRRAAAVVVGSEGLRHSSPLLQGLDHVEVVPYGVDTAWFDPAAVDPAWVRSVRQELGTPLIVAVGRLVHYKGHEDLIEVVRNLEASLAIVGDGPRRAALERRAATVPRARLLGRVGDDELRVLLAAADVFVLPSTNRSESFGIATLEAQAMGTPAVVTDVGTGTAEAIAPGVSGLVVSAGDPRSLAAALSAFLTDGPRRCSAGAAGRLRVLERHTLDVQAAALRTIYRAVVPDR